MCSLAGDIIVEEVLSTGEKSKLSICKKCSTEKSSIILRKTDTYCKSCFLSATVHKFRATLGKHRVIRPNENVLILYRTGHSSTALLHFIRTGLDLSTHKKLKLQPIILYIDENQILSHDKRIELYTEILKEISVYNFPVYFTSLHNYMNNLNQIPKYYKLIDELVKDDTLKNIDFKLNKIVMNLTQYEDSTNICRKQLLIKVAKELKCSVAFTPEISTDVAINLLSNISLGRGANISLDVGILDDRDTDVKILQPLRYFEMKELAFYNFFNHLNPVHVMNPKEKVTTTSVNTLLKKFVNDLQENYPSTVKTVIRTGDKLTCEKNRQICKLCKVPIEIQSQLSSSEARTFSHWVSTHNLSKTELDYSQVFTNIDENLCYGCKNLSFLLHN